MARHRAAAMPGGPILERVRLAPPPTPAELERILSERLADSRQHLQRLFYDLALSTSETVLDCVDELVPGRQVLLGTDYPFAQEVGVTTTLAGLERHPGFDEADRAAIESGNARRLSPPMGDLSVAAGVHNGGDRGSPDDRADVEASRRAVGFVRWRLLGEPTTPNLVEIFDEAGLWRMAARAHGVMPIAQRLHCRIGLPFLRGVATL